MKSKKKLVEEYIQKIISKLCYEYGASLEDARKAVEELDLLNRYKGNYDFVLYQNVSTWVNLIVDRHKKEVERENLKNKTTVKPLTKKYVDEKVEKTLKEFRPNRMDVQTYNKVFLPQWTNASLFIRNLQPTLEGKCDKESLRQLQIIGWNEETKKFISDVLNLYKENVLNELRDISNKPEKKEENTMENYIVINGKKAELTEDQLKALNIEIEKKRNNPFNSKLEDREIYYYNDYSGTTDKHYTTDIRDCINMSRINSFNDKDFAYQIYLHELLNRKLLKYAWDNEAEDCEWDDNDLLHYYIVHDKGYHDRFFVTYSSHLKNISTTYFSKKGIAEQAIKDVVKPFMLQHNEFVW